MSNLPLYAGVALVAAVLAGASATAVHAQSLIVVNQGDATVSIVDARSLSVIHQVPEQQAGETHAHEAAVSPDGRTAYVPVYGDSGVGKPGTDGRELLFIDVATGTTTGRLDFGRGVRPHQAVVDANTGLVYVTTELDRSVTIVDPKTRTVLGRVPTGAEQTHMMVLSHDGRFGYTANVGPGSVSVLDMKARKTLAVIPVAGVVQRIAISSDDHLVFTSDNQLPRLAVIDTSSHTVRQWIALPGLGYGAAATKDGRWLLIAIPELDQLAVIDLRTMKIARTISVGKAPQETLIRPDGQMAYVSNAGDGTVSAIDLVTWDVVHSIHTGSGADGMAWAER